VRPVVHGLTRPFLQALGVVFWSTHATSFGRSISGRSGRNGKNPCCVERKDSSLTPDTFDPFEIDRHRVGGGACIAWDFLPCHPLQARVLPPGLTAVFPIHFCLNPPRVIFFRWLPRGRFGWLVRTAFADPGGGQRHSRCRRFA